MKQILLLGSQHGNETLGDELYARLQTNHSDLLPHVVFRIANPKAHDLGERYIESDMNRSYGLDQSTYESKQAELIETYIGAHHFDLVLDLHTTACSQPPCFIAYQLDGPVGRFISLSSIDRIVHMKHTIVEHSLIGRCRVAVSVEISESDVTPVILDELCDAIRRFVMDDESTSVKKLYVVQSLLAKSEMTENDAAKLQNFELCDQGFVPVLVGENSYKKNTNYLGFKASKETIITL